MNIVIFGGTRGIGSSIAEHLAKRGEGIVSAVSRNEVEASKRLPKVNYIIGDLRDTEGLVGSLSVLIESKPVSLIFSQRYRGTSCEHEQDLMLSAPIRLLERIESALVPGSKLIFLGSVAGEHVIQNQNHLYHCVRSGIEGLVRSISVAYASKGIKCFCVRTTTIIKPENQAYFDAHPEEKRLIEMRTPTRKMVTSHDIATTVSNLIFCDWPSVVTFSIDVDGGAGVVYQGL
jgi:NAD(P)-dependent dehydrogenase (short-subunit alcohol dehydrogenase family)